MARHDRRIGGWPYLVTFLVLVGIGVLISLRAWPFDARPSKVPPTWWGLLLGDRLTVGFVRLAAVALCVWVTVSAIELIRERRWVKTMPPGLTAEDVSSVDATVEDLKSQLREVTNQRDEAVAQRDELWEMVELETSREE